MLAYALAYAGHYFASFSPADAMLSFVSDIDAFAASCHAPPDVMMLPPAMLDAATTRMSVVLFQRYALYALMAPPD